MSEKATLWIVIDNGDVFEGTDKQFADCFFSNATRKTIALWCKENGWAVKFTNAAPAPRRKKTPKTQKILQNHSSVRASQRYGLYLDEERRKEILRMISSGAVTDNCRAIERQSLSRTLFRVVIDGVVCGVVYDKKRHELVTFIPADDPRLQAAPQKRAPKEPS
jgi:hypothetical protein